MQVILLLFVTMLIPRLAVMDFDIGRIFEKFDGDFHPHNEMI